MGKILYRGKEVGSNRWCYGYYCFYGLTNNEKDYIIPEHTTSLYGKEVVHETVGQYTGLNDKSNYMIFEGDIVKISDHPFGYNDSYVVGYSEYMELCCGNLLLYHVRNWCKVIGNIYDNPELIRNERKTI